MDLPKKKQVAVVITTYNNPKSLEICLLSFQNQTYQNFEIFIADDGSKDETRDLILKLKRELPYPIYHHWHPDQGYRKAKINNAVFKQISPEQFPVIIGIDHDVFVHNRFVEDHYRAHAKVSFSPFLFMGRRVDLSPSLSQKVTPENVTDFNRGLSWDFLLSGLKGETKNVLRSIRLNAPKSVLHLLKRDRVFDLLGSNFSISTESMLAVNGYNEDYQSYWGEDGDLFVRIRNRKIPHYGVIGLAVQWHLFHKRLEETDEHVKKYEELLKDESYVRCKNGILKE